MTHLLRNLMTACIATALLAAPAASATSLGGGISQDLTASASAQTPDAYVQAAGTMAAAIATSLPAGVSGQASGLVEAYLEAPAPKASVETRAESRAAAYAEGELSGEGRAEGDTNDRTRVDETARGDLRGAVAAAADADVRVKADTSLVGWMKARVHALVESTVRVTTQFAGYVRGEVDARADDARAEVDHATSVDARGKLEAIVDANVPAPGVHAQVESTTRAVGYIR